MNSYRLDRKLAAVLAADVVGYSRMMAHDEAGALAALKLHRQAVFNPIVERYAGRIIKLIGDGTLVEFGSVVDAVNCALAIQRAVVAEAGASSAGIALRIGINLGDVIVEGDDIYGDGVNIAARLEPLAEPGGICIASIVSESVAGRIDAAFEDGGDVELKNIDRPVRIWRWHPTFKGRVPPSRASAKHGLGPRPSLAVLPFQNMSGSLEQEYFADGIVEDLITALSRFRSFAVIARNSSFVYKGRAIDVRQVARELGVRYVLEGSVRRAGNRLRISAQLVEGASGEHLWAEHFDGLADEVFDFQDRITESVVAIVEPHIQIAEIALSRRERPESLAGYDLYLQTMGIYYSIAPDNNAGSLALISKAIELEPNNPTYLSIAAALLQQRGSMGWESPTGDNRSLCLNYVERALANNHGDACVAARCGNTMIQYLKLYDRGMELVRQAVATNPNNLDVVSIAGVVNVHCGNLDDAVAHFLRAERLNPGGLGANWNLAGLAHAELLRGNYEEALSWASKSMAVNAQFDPCYWMLIAANVRLGRMEEAQRHLAALLTISSGATVASIRAGQAAKQPDRIEPILDALRLAGMPEA